jgi:hypothetical protein
MAAQCLLTIVLIVLVAASAAHPMFPRYLVRPIFVKRSVASYDDGPSFDIAGQGLDSGSLVDYTGAVFGRQSRPQRSLVDYTGAVFGRQSRPQRLWSGMDNDFNDEVNILRMSS